MTTPIMYSLSFVSVTPKITETSDKIASSLALCVKDIPKASERLLSSLSYVQTEVEPIVPSDILIHSISCAHKEYAEHLTIMLRAISTSDNPELHRDMSYKTSEFL